MNEIFKPKKSILRLILGIFCLFCCGAKLHGEDIPSHQEKKVDVPQGKDDPEHKTKEVKDFTVQIQVLPAASLMPGLPGIVYHIANHSDKPKKLEYALIFNVENYLKIVNKETGEELPNFGGNRPAPKDSFVELPPKSVLHFLVSAPQNSLFVDPKPGIYFLRHEEFDSSSRPFELDFSMMPWVIKEPTDTAKKLKPDSK